MSRVKTNRVHFDSNGNKHEVSKQKGENKYFIKNTDTEVTGKTSLPNESHNKSSYDFQKPSDAQDLGDEWDDYAWTADDF